MVQPLFYLDLKFQASNHFLSPNSPVRVGPGRIFFLIIIICFVADICDREHDYEAIYGLW